MEPTQSDDRLMSLMRIKEASKNNDWRNVWSRKLSPSDRLKQLNRQFSNLK